MSFPKFIKCGVEAQVNVAGQRENAEMLRLAKLCRGPGRGVVATEEYRNVCLNLILEGKTVIRQQNLRRIHGYQQGQGVGIQACHAQHAL